MLRFEVSNSQRSTSPPKAEAVKVGITNIAGSSGLTPPRGRIKRPLHANPAHSHRLQCLYF